MKTKRVWTVVWTHYNNECRGQDGPDWRTECAENVDRFSSEARAADFARFRLNYASPAEAFCEEVPVHIANRWSIH